MIYCFDLDGTLCTNTNGDYNNAKPFQDRIAVLRKLYEEGHTILIETARGSVTGIDWYQLTSSQLKEWNCPYHTLRVGIKLNADIYVDDKGIKDTTFFTDITT